MTSTATWFQAATGGRVALVATIEGCKYPLALCESAWRDSLSDLYTDDGYSAPLWGLHVAGKVSQSLEPFEPISSKSTLELVFTDADLTLTQYLLAPGAGAETFADEQISATDNSIAVVDAPGTDAFASACDLHIGRECAQSTSKDGAPDPAFNGLTRGAYSDGRTSAGGRLGRTHRYEVEGDTTGVGFSATISDRPRVIKNRIVSLYAHHLEGSAGGPSVASIADRACLYRGYLDAVSRVGRELRIKVAHLTRALDSQLLAEQLIGEPSGAIILESESTVNLFYVDPAGGTYTGHVHVAAGTYTSVGAIRTALNTALQSITIDAGALVSGHLWTCEFGVTDAADGSLVPSHTNLNLRLAGGGAFPAGASASFTMSAPLHTLLGWDGIGAGCERPSDDLFSATSDRPPVAWMIALSNDGATEAAESGTLILHAVRGTWVDQPRALDIQRGAVGFLKWGDLTLSVSASSYSAGDWTLTVIGYLNSQGTFRGLPELTDEQVNAMGRYGEGDPPQFKQVWLEDGELGETLLRCLVSTGTATTNHATYDDRHPSMSAELPWNYVSAAGFISATTRILLQVEKPQSIKAAFGPMLGACGLYLIDSGGTFSLRRLPWETSVGVVRTITQSDLAGDFVPEQAWGVDAVVNRIGVKAGIEPFMEATTAAATDLQSMSDNGPNPGPTFDAAGLRDLDAWAHEDVGNALGYFAKGPQRINLTTGWPLATLETCELVALTHPGIIDPTTGAEGVTSLAAWVASAGFDYSTGKGECSLALLSGRPARNGAWTPAARVASYSHPWITLEAHQYSTATDDADANAFTTGDQIQIHSIDASTTAASYAVAITNTDAANNRIEISGSAITGFPGTRTWDVGFPALASVASQQIVNAYHSDDGATVDDARVDSVYRWAGTQGDATDTFAGTATYPDLGEIATGQGSACAANVYHWAALTLDQIARYRGRTQLVSDAYSTAVVSPSGVTLTGWHLFKWGVPFEYPSNAEAWRSLVLLAMLNTSATAVWSVRPVLSRSLPLGAGLAAGQYVFPGAITIGTDITVNSTTYALKEQAITPGRFLSGRWFLNLLAKRTSSTGNLQMRDLSLYGV